MPLPQADIQSRTFLFLQGPHGPFFWRLARMLRMAGTDVWRVGFNGGDGAFWPDGKSYLPFRAAAEAWPDHLDALLTEKSVTDLVLYGDVRPRHAEAIAKAKSRGITVHVFEEGYLRPYWVTYERDGTNGHSRLMKMSVEEMRAALALRQQDTMPVPAHWGDMRHHIFYGALYHTFVLGGARRYRGFQRHRTLSVRQEMLLYTRRLALMPFLALSRRIATTRLTLSGYPYHLALMQLEHDSSFQAHSPFDTSREFIAKVIEGFATGAPPHHHLVFKAHPLDTGQSPHRRHIRTLAREHGVTGRVHFLHGGKLAALLDDARSAVTVNSTAAQQVLRRGLPLLAFGDAVYGKPEFVSSQEIEAFFAQPDRPDAAAYADYRRFLLETSQVPGGYYAARSRRRLLRLVVDMMLAEEDPYDAFAAGRSAPRQHLQAVS